MSVASKNPFELLGDDEDRSSSPAPKAKPAAAPAATQAPKVVPGAAPKGAARGARYPTRGGPRNVYKEDRPAEASGAAEGFEGERVAPSKGDRRRDRHTAGPREDRGQTGPRSRAPGAGPRGPKGGNRAPRTGAQAPADKKPENWGTEEGKAELSAEKAGEKDGAEAAAIPEAAEEAEAEEEDNSKTLDQYLAERAQQALGGDLAKKEARTVSADDIKGKVFEREQGESFFSGKAEKAKEAKNKEKKAGKVFLEIDGQFARTERPPREDRPARGGRGGARGRAPRGAAPRGAAPRKAAQAAADVNDVNAFPSLA